MCSTTLISQAQQLGGTGEYNHKGRMYFYWGYNISGYANSNLHFEGEGYDFVVHYAKALDRPKPYSNSVYLAPKRFTIPQYNYRVGYFLNDNWSISLGLDHMKYVFRQNQYAQISGTITEEASPEYAGTYDHTEILINDDFLMFEHSDGLNYISLQAEYNYKLWQSDNKLHEFHAIAGVGAGPVVTRSDVRIFGEGLNNDFALSGYGGSILGALRLNVYKSLFFQLTGNWGYINLTEVLTTGQPNARAYHHFGFTQASLVIGGSIPLRKKRSADGITTD